MKKNLVFPFILILILTSCNFNQSIKLQEEARKNADFIIENLDKQEVVNQFPKEFFPNTLQIKQFIDELRLQCGYKSRIGKFVDQFTERNLGAKQDRISFIYEFYLLCDSLRFTLTYTLHDSAVLSGMHYQKLNEINPMILDPSKKLENSSFDFKQTYDNGNTLLEGHILNGKKNGLWKNYNENGILAGEVSYANDLYEGPIRLFYQSGKIRTTGQHTNNNEDGKWISYYEDGKKSRESDYQNGILLNDKYFLSDEKPVSIAEVKKHIKDKILKAKNNSDFILHNFTSPGILNEFPDKNFSMENKNQINQLIITLSNLCEYPNGKKSYIADYYSISLDEYYLFYETYLKCDTLRFVFSYNLKENPELLTITYEPIENKNDLLISAYQQDRK